MDRVGGIIDGGADDLALVLGETLGGGNGAGQLSRVDSGYASASFAKIGHVGPPLFPPLPLIFSQKPMASLKL